MGEVTQDILECRV